MHPVDPKHKLKNEWLYKPYQPSTQENKAGDNDNLLNSSETISEYGWEAGPDLPTAVYEHAITKVNWPCQRNLIKTFQNEANTPLIKKITLKMFLNISGQSY